MMSVGEQIKFTQGDKAGNCKIYPVARNHSPIQDYKIW